MKTRDLKDRIVSLLEVEHLASANAVVEKLAESEASFNKSSVYRALDQLVETNTICEHNFSGKSLCTNFALITILTYTAPLVAQFLLVHVSTHSPKKSAVFVDHHHITLIGTCSDCQKQ